jgi:hypothetical protein
MARSSRGTRSARRARWPPELQQYTQALQARTAADQRILQHVVEMSGLLTLEQARESLYRTVLEADASRAARGARYRAAFARFGRTPLVG